MKKIILTAIIFIGCFGISYGTENKADIKPVKIQLIEPVQLKPVHYLEAPQPDMSEEKMKALKEKEALESIEDIQAKEENSPEITRETQSAVTDTVNENEYKQEDVIELVPIKTNRQEITKDVKTKYNYGVGQIDYENENPAGIHFNSGSIYRF